MSGKVWHSFHWSAPAKAEKYKIQNTEYENTKYKDGPRNMNEWQGLGIHSDAGDISRVRPAAAP